MTATTKSCSNSTPPWFTGRWKDWHRGHGCGQDDGKPRSDAAITEIAQHAANAASGFLTDAELSFLRASTTSGNTLLVRALEELATRRNGPKRRQESPDALRSAQFDHSARTSKLHFGDWMGYCVCTHCVKLPEREPSEEAAR